jgi:hypothetical protein
MIRAHSDNATMPRCHICGESGLYTEMMDNTVFSIRPKCEHLLLFTSHNQMLPRNLLLAISRHFLQILTSLITAKSSFEIVINTYTLAFDEFE